MNNSKILGHIGLAARARKLTSGEDQVLDSIRSKRAKIVFLASDAGINTTKRITDKCAYYQIMLINDLSSDDITKAIGKENRKVIAIIDQQFAQMIKSEIEI